VCTEFYLQQPEGTTGTGLSIRRKDLVQGCILEIDNTTAPTLNADLRRDFRSRGSQRRSVSTFPSLRVPHLLKIDPAGTATRFRLNRFSLFHFLE